MKCGSVGWELIQGLAWGWAAVCRAVGWDEQVGVGVPATEMADWPGQRSLGPTPRRTGVHLTASCFREPWFVSSSVISQWPEWGEQE